VAALGSLLNSMNTLKTLNMGGMIYLDDAENSSEHMTPQGWVRLFTSLQDSDLNLVKLYLGENQIDDDGLHLLIPLVSNMTSLKHFSLSANHSITPTGWQALTGYLQSPNFALEKLTLGENKINNATLAAFMSDLVLVHNKTLKRFYLDDCFDDNEYTSLITEIGWEAVSTLLCNKTSIMDTYSSNHILQALGWDHDQINMPDDLLPYLELNENKDKAEVARQKILQTHFSDNDTSKLQVLLDMEVEMMPTVIAWIGRPTHANWRGTKMSGLSLMYNLMHRSPNFALEKLYLCSNNINDDTVVALTSALLHNKTLKELDLEGCEYDSDNDEQEVEESITEIGWEAVSTLLCNKISIWDTYNSNHTLEYVGEIHPTDDLVSYLALNINEDKVEVARQKILHTHFSSEDDEKIQEFLDMELEVMPTAIAWIGRPTHASWIGTNVSGLSLLYNLMRRLPDLFDSNPQKKPSTGKSYQGGSVESDTSK